MHTTLFESRHPATATTITITGSGGSGAVTTGQIMLATVAAIYAAPDIALYIPFKL